MLADVRRSQLHPPFRTDDPEPVATGHFEFYTFSQGLYRDHTSAASPGDELNYGLIPNGQLTIGGEAATSDAKDAVDHYGLGDTGLSFKYRFIDETPLTPLSPQVSIYPEIDFPLEAAHEISAQAMSASSRQFGCRKVLATGPRMAAEGMRSIRNANLGDKNNWFFGWLLERKITENLILGGEIFDQREHNVDVKNETGFNVGGTYDLDAHDHLNVSLGRDIQTAQYNWYFGWEITY